jgi:hypothetical protein
MSTQTSIARWAKVAPFALGAAVVFVGCTRPGGHPHPTTPHPTTGPSVTHAPTTAGPTMAPTTAGPTTPTTRPVPTTRPAPTTRVTVPPTTRQTTTTMDMGHGEHGDH